MANEQAQQLRLVMTMIKVSLGVLNHRFMAVLSLAISAGLFAWVMWAPDYTRLGGAIAYAVLINWPLFSGEQKQVEPGEAA